METNEAIPNDVPKEFRLKVPVKRSSSDLVRLLLNVDDSNLNEIL